MDEPGDAPVMPEHWAADVVLSDGGTVHVRPIRPDDADRLRDLHGRLSPEAVYYRFFTPMPRLSDTMVERLVNVDYRERMAIVAILGDKFIAVARYDHIDTDRAEVAFVVDDTHQGRGLGTLMLEHLAVIARANGIGRFEAQTLSDNQAMLRVFRGAGFEVKRRFDGGVVEVEFSIAPTERSLELIDTRDRRAVANSIRRLLHPTSVAVIGASREPGTVGYELVRHLLDAGFAGPVFPVNPNAGDVGGVYAFPSVLDIPVPVDLAVVAVAAPGVLEVVQECARKGVVALVIVSSGFAETGSAGRDAERAVVELARRNGMRIIGPNSMGVVNTDPAIRLNATFAPVAPSAGGVGFMSQSGALGIALLAESEARQLGISTFVAAGNKADVSGNDLLQYWELDDATDVILLYLESFGNPRRFTRIARRVARTKPVVAVKAGRGRDDARADASHSAALAPPHVVADAVLRQAGVTRVDTLEQLFDVAQAFAHQPLPAGRRVAIVGNASGPGILAADAALAEGLVVADLAPATLARLAAGFPAMETMTNPVDIGTTGTAEQLDEALRAVLEDPGVDAVITVYLPPLQGRDAEMISVIAAASADHPDKPVLANVLTGPAAIGLGTARVPVYRFPEGAVHALALMAERTAWLARPEAEPPEFEFDLEPARTLIADFLAATPDGGWLPPDTALRFAALMELPVLTSRLVATADEAAAAATALGFPVAVKAAAPELASRMELGALVLGLESAEQVHAAAAEMIGRLGDRLGGLLVQPSVRPGLDLITGLTTDEVFGPLVVFGLGGIRAELLLDRVVHSAPLTDHDAHCMIRELRTSPLLFGFRGSPAVDTAGLEALLVRLGWLAEQLPEIVELDLNPLITNAEGAVALDFRVRVEPFVEHPERALRSLRSLRTT